MACMLSQQPDIERQLWLAAIGGGSPKAAQHRFEPRGGLCIHGEHVSWSWLPQSAGLLHQTVGLLSQDVNMRGTQRRIEGDPSSKRLTHGAQHHRSL